MHGIHPTSPASLTLVNLNGLTYSLPSSNSKLEEKPAARLISIMELSFNVESSIMYTIVIGPTNLDLTFKWMRYLLK